MSIKVENECCNCAVPSYPCLGNSCQNRNVPYVYCDLCGKEMNDNEEQYDLSVDYHICDKCLEDKDDE